MKILNDTSRKFKKEAPKGATHRCEGDWFKYGIHGWVFWWDGVEWVKSTKTKLPNNSRIR